MRMLRAAEREVAAIVRAAARQVRARVTPASIRHHTHHYLLSLFYEANIDDQL